MIVENKEYKELKEKEVAYDKIKVENKALQKTVEDLEGQLEVLLKDGISVRFEQERKHRYNHHHEHNEWFDCDIYDVMVVSNNLSVKLLSKLRRIVNGCVKTHRRKDRYKDGYNMISSILHDINNYTPSLYKSTKSEIIKIIESHKV